MHICAYIYIYIYIYIHTHTHIHTIAHARIHTLTKRTAQIYICLYTCVYAYMHACFPSCIKQRAVFTAEPILFSRSQHAIQKYAHYRSNTVRLCLVVVGKFTHPFYKYLTTNAPNPNNVTRITLNYEKFLVNSEGKVLA